MTTDNNIKPVPKSALWAGRVIGWLPALFLLFAACMNFVKPESAVKQTVAMGFSEKVMVPLGVVLLVSTLLYLVPATSVLGAILLTGYLGGAVATHVHVWDGWFPVFFPVIFGVLLWLGLWLRDPRLRAVIPCKC
jgi:hypothetical protein